VLQHRYQSSTEQRLRAMAPPALDMAPPLSPPPPQNPLSIRPAKQQRPYPEYPIKIPPEKQGKALELYNTLKLAEMLAQNDTATHNDGYLLAPGPSTARSVTSQTSSRHNGAQSTSASAYDGTTDFGGSVVSFDQSPPSTIEFTAFTGKKVKPRKRKRLGPTARAKAALVRYLGSCWPCRSRRVPVSNILVDDNFELCSDCDQCPLDHHDIQCLENLRLLMPKEETRPEPQPSPLSAASGSSQKTARSVTKQEPAPSTSDSALLGIGAQLPDIEMDLDLDDILSTGPQGNYDRTQAERPAPATLNRVAPNLSIINPNPYAAFQHGALFSLGCLRNGQFHCQHLELCQQRLSTAEELQFHFATSHFEFTRIDPAHRYICSNCKSVSLSPVDPCKCPTLEFIELWICGHFIKRQWYQRDGSDGSDFQGYHPGSNDFDPYGGPNPNSPWDPSMNQRHFGTGGNSQGHFSFQGGNTYERTGNQGFGWNASNGSGSGSNPYQANFLGAWQMAWDGQYKSQIFCLKTQHQDRRLMSLLILLLLLSAIIFGFSNDWIITKARMTIPRAAAGIRSHLPALGFFIIMASIAMCLSIQHLTFRRARCVSITILVLDDLVHKHADDFQRELDVLFTLLRTALCRLHADQSDLNILCVVSPAYDGKGGNEFTLTPHTKHELQRPP
jgi:hypothetical protein